MCFSTKDIEDIARLTRLRLTDTEKDKFKNDLNVIMDWINTLKSVNIDGVEPLLNVASGNSPIREDIVLMKNSRASVLMNAPDPDQDDIQQRKFFTVPKVLE